MQIIRCTKKLQKAMGLKTSDLVEVAPYNSLLGSWHANLIDIDRTDCILFVNDQTLFNFIIPDVPKTQIKDLSHLFKGFLQCVLAEEGFPQSIQQAILADYADIDYSNTNSKKVLGSMNDMAFHYQCHIEDCGIHSYLVPNIIKKINRIPFKSIGYKYPIELLNSLYGISK